jgi:hypothetical protein
MQKLVLIALALAIASYAGWAQSTGSVSEVAMAGTAAMDVLTLQSSAKSLPVSAIEDLI